MAVPKKNNKIIAGKVEAIIPRKILTELPVVIWNDFIKLNSLSSIATAGSIREKRELYMEATIIIIK